jgi:FtsZ-interacting cell division protein ZipA
MPSTCASSRGATGEKGLARERACAVKAGTPLAVEMVVIIGGIGLALASAIVTLVVRAWRRRVSDENNDRGAHARRPAEKEARPPADQEAQPEAEEAQRHPEEQAKRAAEDTGTPADQEAQPEAEEARPDPEEQAQGAADDTGPRDEEEARPPADPEVQREGEEPRPPAEEESLPERGATEQETPPRPQPADAEVIVDTEVGSPPRNGSPAPRRAPRYRPPGGTPPLNRHGRRRNATRR